MPPGINTCITWSILELRGLLEDEDTRVYCQRANKHLGLHPFHLNNLNRALREILDSNVNFYDIELQGLVLAYKNPKLVSSLGAILHDSYFIHVDVEADFYLFKPEIGCILKGIANKKATNHLGVLVHKAFNVSIPKPENSDEWLGDYVFVGQEVKFVVTHLDFKGKLLFVRGELISSDASRSTYYNDESVETNDEKDKKETISSSSHDRVYCESKRKRSKKSKVIDSSGDETSDGDDKRKVFRKEKSKSRCENSDELPSEKPKGKISNDKKKVFDPSPEESSEDEKEEKRKIKSKEAEKPQRVRSESSESENETRIKRKTNFSPKILSKENGNSHENIEADKSSEEKPKVKSLNGETSAKKKKKKRSKIDCSSDTSIEPDESLEGKSRISESLKVEKSEKNKHKKVEITSNSLENSEQQDRKFVTDRKLPVDSDEDRKNFISPKKRRIIDSDNEDDTTEVEVKSEIQALDKKKSKKHKKEVAKLNSDEEKQKAESNEQNDRNFEFIKPEIKPEHKRKRRKTITLENEMETSDFFRDIRIKVEPDPSDIEDSAPRENSMKRRKETSSIKEENKRRKNEASDVETSFDNIGIKTEPDSSSDVEDVKPGKRKSKKRNAERDSFENIKIKVEPNTSDVEDSKFKKRLKIEPQENKVKIDSSPRKSDEA